MQIYFLILRIAALFGHRKARLLVAGQQETLRSLSPEDAPDLRGCIWFHAASVGEFEQARPIIERLKKEQPQTKVLLTFFSPSGYEMRKNYGQADYVCYLPFATRRNAHAFLNKVQPKMAIFVKYEFWPAYLKALRKRQITTWLISAIFRPNQLFFKPWGIGYRQLLKCFDRLFVQDDKSLQLLDKYGIKGGEVAGDTRFDRVNEVKAKAVSVSVAETFVGDAKQVIVAGSTWQQDEALLARYVTEHEDTKLILVPHEIDENHLHQIFLLLKGRCVRYTQATAVNLLHARVLVVDTMGLLSSIYRYGQVAYVGGGFGAGIHNTLEPAVYGMPVLFGPKYTHFREACGLIEAGAAQSVHNYETLNKALDEAFAHQAEMGYQATEYVKSELGATEKIYKHLSK